MVGQWYGGKKGKRRKLGKATHESGGKGKGASRILVETTQMLSGWDWVMGRIGQEGE